MKARRIVRAAHRVRAVQSLLIFVPPSAACATLAGALCREPAAAVTLFVGSLVLLVFAAAGLLRRTRR